jgi:hypothetical protein
LNSADYTFFAIQMLKIPTLILVLCFGVLLVSCSPAATPAPPVQVVVEADGKQAILDVPTGSSVLQVLQKANIQLNNLDRVDPESFSLITAGEIIKVIRVTEEFEVEEQTIPFEHQTVQNESLPEGQTVLIQPGSNGSQQITYRKVLEDGIPKSRNIFQIATSKDPVPEIVMVGVQTPFTPISIPGRMAYIIAGNAWVMEGSTGARRPVVTTGDLDGRVFSISLDGRWLLFTRKAKSDSKDINTVFAIDIAHEGQKPLDLGIKNVIHHAGWIPNQENTFSYSTVEPRDAPPGWQANNDLYIMTFTSSGNIIQNDQIIEPNSGGNYGWWGTDFFWSPDGRNLAYARPDSLGTVDLKEGKYIPSQQIIPFESQSDWAWIPPVNWSPDSKVLYFTDHVPTVNDPTSESSPDFSLRASFLNSNPPVTIIPLAGMFAYPSASPIQPGGRFQLAYLQAIFPSQSDSSRYRLVLMDRDGSNKEVVFPPEGSIGLEPQNVIWSPEDDKGLSSRLGFLYQGNIWFLDLKDQTAHQVTGDGLITNMDWR